LRILFIAHSNAPWTPYYCRHFLSRGDNVHLISFSPDQIAGVPMSFVGIEPFDQFKGKHLFLTRVPQIRRILREFDPDVVVAPYLISNGLTAVLAWHGPLLLSARGGDVMVHPGRTGWKRRLREAIIRFLCGRASHIHAVSQGIVQRLTSLGVPLSRITRFPTGVNTELFHPGATMPRSRATRLICTRKHEPVYDMPTIIEALIRLNQLGPEFHCTLIGDGHLRPQLEAQVRQGGIADHVQFRGHVPHAELPALLREADIYLSAAISDGTSSSLLEAMATGLLPVVSRIEANQAWLHEGTDSLMFSPGRVDEFVTALKRALDDHDLRVSAMERNRKRVEQDGNMHRNMERLAELCESLAAGKA
jgi:glycosyltransferase involved in cell wall biosynthesis